MTYIAFSQKSQSKFFGFARDCFVNGAVRLLHLTISDNYHKSQNEHRPGHTPDINIFVQEGQFKDVRKDDLRTRGEGSRCRRFVLQSEIGQVLAGVGRQARQDNQQYIQWREAAIAAAAAATAAPDAPVPDKALTTHDRYGQTQHAVVENHYIGRSIVTNLTHRRVGQTAEGRTEEGRDNGNIRVVFLAGVAVAVAVVITCVICKQPRRMGNEHNTEQTDDGPHHIQHMPTLPGQTYGKGSRERRSSELQRNSIRQRQMLNGVEEAKHGSGTYTTPN
mmetsp:Transcript_23916/g.52960  ORF Transcript_23916/g.52960 Transcript_23916/m.52960 type:complete len:277 (-) Transcript_23916:467-1297(-)